MYWSTCYGQETHYKRKRKISRPTEKKTKGTQFSNWEEISKELQHFPEIQISDDEWKKSMSSLTESIESGEFLPSSSEWKLHLDDLYVTCLSRKNKIVEPIPYYLDLFINTTLNLMLIRSHLVSLPKNEVNSNSEQLFNSTDYNFRYNSTSKSTW